MASLLDRIKNVGSAGLQPQQKGIQKILQEKGGKAGSGGGPRASSLGEQSAITAGKEALKEQTFAERVSNVQAQGREQALTEEQALQQQQLRQQGEQQQQRLAAEAAATREGLAAGQEEAGLRRDATTESKIKDLNTQAEQQLRDMASQKNIKLDDIFAQYEFDTADLEDRKDAAQLEQQAFSMAMQDRKYLDELNQIGQERQLQNDLAFDKEMQRIVMGDSLTGLLKELDFKTGRAAKQRDFNSQLANIDLDTALAMSKAIVRDDAERAKWKAAGDISSTLIQKGLEE